MKKILLLAASLFLVSTASFAQTLRLNDEGTFLGNITAIDCVGAGVTCDKAVVGGRNIGTLNIPGGGGAGAPDDATYWTGSANGTLTNEINLGALGTGLVLNTAGTPSILAGNTCAANNFGISISASGVLGCSQPLFSNLSGSATDGQIPNNITIDLATLAATATALAANGGNCSGNNFALGVDASGVGECAQPAFSNLSGSATNAQIPDDITITLAATATALAANGGNCSGNNFALGVDASGVGECAQPAFTNLSGAATDAQVPNTITLDNLTQITTRAISDTTGTLAVARGGTALTTFAENTIPLATALDVLAATLLPSCSNPTTSKLLYNNATHVFSCGVDQSGAGGSANVVQVSLSLGTGMGLIYSTTVTGQTWVTATSVIACSPFGTTADGQTVETVAASAVQASVSNLVDGDGFNLNVYSPHGATGTFRFGCTGA